MEEQDYLIHYGVLGMKWGVRKDRNYKYTSMRTKHLTKKAAKAKAKGKKNAEKLASKAKTSKQIDRKLLSYAKKTSTGKALAQNLLMGPAGAKSYATMRATGSSRKKAVTTQILSRSAGIALGVLMGGAAGAALTKYPSLVDQTNLLTTVLKVSGKSNADAATLDKALSAVGKMSDNIYKSAMVANARAGAATGVIAGDAAGASNAISKKKKKK